VMASALMHTLFGVLAALFGSNLQVIFQEPWVIVLFSTVFVLLSLSMFDCYTLAMPSFIQGYLHRKSEDHRDGSYLGAGVMGALSSLIVGPCVAAPLAAALVFIGQTGDVVLGGSALFVMSLGMGFPLLIVGASAGKLLPKAGVWLNTTKSVFGILMLGVSTWMLSRILPVSVTMVLVAALMIIPAVYMGALEPLAQGVSGWKRLWKGLGLMMLIFGVLEMIGVSAGSESILHPLKGFHANAKTVARDNLAFKHIQSRTELEVALAEARQQGKPVMLDFYADWCVACKELEAYTFSDANVHKALSGYQLLQIDVTANTDEDQALLKQYRLVGPPAILFWDAAGQPLSQRTVIGFQAPEIFLGTLSRLGNLKGSV
jgi:thioredoxin:protein disulfide reductase